MNKISKSKAIKTYCFECAGDSTHDVTLCPVTDCPLWEYRTGQHISSNVYKKRMETTIKNYPDEIAEMLKDEPLNKPFFTPSANKIVHGKSKRGEALERYREKKRKEKSIQ
jgi:uncharacterized protein YcaQ